MLEHKTILLTGASSGIGAATATALVDAGATVYGLCRHPEKLPAEVLSLRCDLTEAVQIEEAFASLSHLDILINNAGRAYLSPITSGDPTHWEEMWKLNVHAPALCIQKALALFPESGGHIVNVSSLSGHRVPPSGGFYAPTKFALRALTESTRAELKAVGNATRISSISPGFVDTPLLDTYFQGRESQLAQTKATLKMLTPQDIAASILHLLQSPSGVEINDLLLRSADQSI